MDDAEPAGGRHATAAETARAIIEHEHRTLGTVVSALQQWLARVAVGHAEPDFAFLASAICYVGDFPERVHHPKEDNFLFSALLRRTHRLDAVIDGLSAEHVRGTQMIAVMEHALVRYQGGASEGLESLKRAVDAYAAMLREHMHKEEGLLAEAAACLEAGDWEQIAAAFEANDDPLFGAEFAKLYNRIINSVPTKLRPRKRS